MIKVSFIDRATTYSLDDLIEQETLNEYDEDILPFLRSYSDNSPVLNVSTSGSTGKPKLIAIQKDRMVASAKATIEYFDLVKKNKILFCLPTKFIAGKMIWVRAIVGEFEIVVSKPTSNPIKELNQSIDFAAMTPHQVAVSLGESPEKFDLIDKLIIGGGTVNSSLLKHLQTLSTNCFATYGMTETITHVAIKRLNGINAKETYSSVGETTFEIGEKNNLIINAPHLNSEKIITNDVVKLIDQNHFIWLGRLDFVINSGSVKLFPEQIEKKLEKVMDQNFFIWKEKDDLLGEKVILVIEGEWNDKINLSSYLEKLETPKKVYSVKQFVYTENGKLDRPSTVNKIN